MARTRCPRPPSDSVLLLFLGQFKSPLIYILFVAAALAVAMGKWGDAAVILVVVLVERGHRQRFRRGAPSARWRRCAGCPRCRCACCATARSRPSRRATWCPATSCCWPPATRWAPMRGCSTRRRWKRPRPRSPANRCRWPSTPQPLPEDTGAGRPAQHGLLRHPHHRRPRHARWSSATGAHTEVGKIARLTEQARGAEDAAGTAHRAVRPLAGGARRWCSSWSSSALGLLRGMPFADILMVAISQMVSMVPEGLPVAMTIALAVGMQRMAGRGAIVRRLSAVETLGSTTVICSDKTGTLTRNEMTVTPLWLPDGRDGRRVTASGYAPEGALTEAGAAAISRGRGRRARCCEAAALCNDAATRAARTTTMRAWRARRSHRGRAALARAARPASTATRCARQWPRGAEIPFDSDTKMMATQPRPARTRSAVCSSRARRKPCCACARADGQAALQAARDAAEAHGGAGAARARRRRGGGRRARSTRTRASMQLAGRATFLGLIGQMDPPREEVKAAVAAVPRRRHPAGHGHRRPQGHRPGHRARARHRARRRPRRGRRRAGADARGRTAARTSTASPSSPACIRRRSCASSRRSSRAATSWP